MTTYALMAAYCLLANVEIEPTDGLPYFTDCQVALVVGTAYPTREGCEEALALGATVPIISGVRRFLFCQSIG